MADPHETSKDEMTYDALVSVFGALDATVQESGRDYDTLLQWLTREVEQLMARQPALLMSHLYRIDVPEAAVRRTLAEAPPSDVGRRLAELMIERQLQKLRLRREYGAE